MTYFSISGVFFLMFAYYFNLKSDKPDDVVRTYIAGFEVFAKWMTGLLALVSLVFGLISYSEERDFPDWLVLTLIFIIFIISFAKTLLPYYAKEDLVYKYQSGQWDGSRKFYFGRWYRIRDSILESSDTCAFGSTISHCLPDIGMNFYKIIFSTDYPFEICKRVTKMTSTFGVNYAILNKYADKYGSYFFLTEAQNGGVYVGEIDENGDIFQIFRFEKGQVKDKFTVDELGTFGNCSTIWADIFCKPKFVKWSSDEHCDNGISCFQSFGEYFIVFDNFAHNADIYDCVEDDIVFTCNNVKSIATRETLSENGKVYGINITYCNGKQQFIRHYSS